MLTKDLRRQKDKFGEAQLDPIKLYTDLQRERVGKFTKDKGLLLKPNAVQTGPVLIGAFDEKIAMIREYTDKQEKVARQVEEDMWMGNDKSKSPKKIGSPSPQSKKSQFHPGSFNAKI